MDAEQRYKLRRELVLACVDTSYTTPRQNPNPPPVPPLAPGTWRAGAPAAPPGASLAARAALTKPQKEAALHCPRCNSDSTKFCCFNNNSLVQPRYFCKTCRRYWTQDGSLRNNAPVGGGSRRKNRRRSPAAAAVSSGAVPDGSGTGLERSGVCDTGATMAGNGAVCVLSAMELRSTGGDVPLQHVQLGMPAEYAAAGFGLAEFRMPPPPPLSRNAAGRLLLPFEDLWLAATAAGAASSGAGPYEHSKDQGGDDGVASRVADGV